jgi:hypothetical protein
MHENHPDAARMEIFARAPDYACFDQKMASLITGDAESTMEKQRHRGDGPPFVKSGRKVLYQKGALIAYLESRLRQVSTSENSATLTYAEGKRPGRPPKLPGQPEPGTVGQI